MTYDAATPSLARPSRAGAPRPAHGLVPEDRRSPGCCQDCSCAECARLSSLPLPLPAPGRTTAVTVMADWLCAEDRALAEAGCASDEDSEDSSCLAAYPCAGDGTPRSVGCPGTCTALPAAPPSTEAGSLTPPPPRPWAPAAVAAAATGAAAALPASRPGGPAVGGQPALRCKRVLATEFAVAATAGGVNRSGGSSSNSSNGESGFLWPRGGGQMRSYGCDAPGNSASGDSSASHAAASGAAGHACAGSVQGPVLTGAGGGAAEQGGPPAKRRCHGGAVAPPSATGEGPPHPCPKDHGEPPHGSPSRSTPWVQPLPQACPGQHGMPCSLSPQPRLPAPPAGHRRVAWAPQALPPPGPRAGIAPVQIEQVGSPQQTQTPAHSPAPPRPLCPVYCGQCQWQRALQLAPGGQRPQQAPGAAAAASAAAAPAGSVPVAAARPHPQQQAPQALLCVTQAPVQGAPSALAGGAAPSVVWQHPGSFTACPVGTPQAPPPQRSYGSAQSSEPYTASCGCPYCSGGGRSHDGGGSTGAGGLAASGGRNDDITVPGRCPAVAPAAAPPVRAPPPASGMLLPQPPPCTSPAPPPSPARGQGSPQQSGGSAPVLPQQQQRQQQEQGARIPPPHVMQQLVHWLPAPGAWNHAFADRTSRSAPMSLGCRCSGCAARHAQGSGPVAVPQSPAGGGNTGGCAPWCSPGPGAGAATQHRRSRSSAVPAALYAPQAAATAAACPEPRAWPSVVAPQQGRAWPSHVCTPHQVAGAVAVRPPAAVAATAVPAGLPAGVQAGSQGAAPQPAPPVAVAPVALGPGPGLVRVPAHIPPPPVVCLRQRSSRSDASSGGSALSSQPCLRSSAAGQAAAGATAGACLPAAHGAALPGFVRAAAPLPSGAALPAPAPQLQRPPMSGAPGMAAPAVAVVGEPPRPGRLAAGLGGAHAGTAGLPLRHASAPSMGWAGPAPPVRPAAHRPVSGPSGPVANDAYTPIASGLLSVPAPPQTRLPLSAWPTGPRVAVGLRCTCPQCQPLPPQTGRAPSSGGLPGAA